MNGLWHREEEMEERGRYWPFYFSNARQPVSQTDRDRRMGDPAYLPKQVVVLNVNQALDALVALQIRFKIRRKR